MTRMKRTTMSKKSKLKDEPSKCPDRNDSLAALELLDKFSLFSSESDSIRSKCQNIERHIEQHFKRPQRQMCIESFFSIM